MQQTLNHEDDWGHAHGSSGSEPVRQLDKMDAVDIARRAIQPLSDEWFTDLDGSIDDITKTFEQLQVSQPPTQEDVYIKQAEYSLAGIQKELMQCLAALQNAKSRLGESITPTTSESERPFFARTPESSKKEGSTVAPINSAVLRPSPDMSSGEKVMKQLFKWWRPYGSGCVRDMQRLGESRMTEVDGQLIL